MPVQDPQRPRRPQPFFASRSAGIANKPAPPRSSGGRSSVLAWEADRRLIAAQLMGAGALAALGQLVVNMPKGYFGATIAMTPFGYGFAFLQLLLMVAPWWTRGRNRRLVYGFAFFLLLLNIGTFLAPLGTDPVLAGSLLLWHAALLGRLIFPTPPLTLRPKAGDAMGAWLATHGPAVRHLLLVSLIASIAVVGYKLSDQPFALLICLFLAGLAISFSAPLLYLLWQSGSRFRVPVLGAIFVVALLFAAKPAITLTLLAIYQLAVLVQLVLRLPSLISAGEIFFGRPEILICWTFLAIITVGTVLLTLPISAAEGHKIAPIDALFTATSAVCVTGLTTLDITNAFSSFGHLVIMLLVQVGGLNIMVLSAFAAVLVGRGLSLRNEKVLGEMLDQRPERSVYPLVRFIVGSTLLIEGVGAVLIAIAYLKNGEPFGSALWKSTFLAVSAFCNAGFALDPNNLNLIPFQRDALMLLTVSGLITLGGIGFTVLAAGWARLVNRRESAVATQVRMVLWASGALLVAGTVVIAALEWNASLAGLEPAYKWVNAILQSVTTRTAGFNSVEMRLIQPATVLVMIIWMFIGASPGGTGGGIKTTTATVLFSILPAIARGRQHVVIFGRALPLEIVYRSAAITVVSGSTVFVATGILLATQSGDLRFDQLLFEVVSALGTVGLSLDVTPRLDTFGKAMIAVVMFLGRIGPLTLALLLARQEASRVAYPEARVMVG
jgi:trk system potassium uptake protein TrkH